MAAPALLAVERVLAAAATHLTLGEDAKHQNAGPYVAGLLAQVGLGPGYPWCAAFVSVVGHRALLDRALTASRWPVPKTAACKAIGDWAATAGCLVTAPERGDLFLLWFPQLDGGRFGHVGFVAEVLPDGRVRTTEGNSNADGSRDGWQVVTRLRRVDPAAGHRFVRWTKALA